MRRKKILFLLLLLCLTIMPINAQNLKVYFTSDSEKIVGKKMTVDIEKMSNQDAGIWEAFLEKDVVYKWYKNKQLIKNSNSASLSFKENDANSEFYVEVICYDLKITSDTFIVSPKTEPIKITTNTLPNAKVNETYNVQLESTAANVTYDIYLANDSKNEFDKTNLTISSVGQITGIPNKAGMFTFTIQARDGNSTDTKTYTLKIEEAPVDEDKQNIDIQNSNNNNVMIIAIACISTAIITGLITYAITKKKNK